MCTRQEYPRSICSRCLFLDGNSSISDHSTTENMQRDPLWMTPYVIQTYFTPFFKWVPRLICSWLYGFPPSGQILIASRKYVTSDRSKHICDDETNPNAGGWLLTLAVFSSPSRGPQQLNSPIERWDAFLISRDPDSPQLTILRRRAFLLQPSVNV